MQSFCPVVDERQAVHWAWGGTPAVWGRCDPLLCVWSPQHSHSGHQQYTGTTHSTPWWARTTFCVALLFNNCFAWHIIINTVCLIWLVQRRSDILCPLDQISSNALRHCIITFYAGSLHFYDPPYPEGYFVQEIQMDFFNYAGLHRPVRLYTTPSSIHLDDITTVTSMNSDGSATLHYTLEVTKIEQNILNCRHRDRICIYSSGCFHARHCPTYTYTRII